MSEIKICDYIVEFLLSKSIDVIFTLSGGFIGPILNSISKYDIKYYCFCHEQACAMAADAYYRISKKPCCLLITNGPGSTNTLTGVIGAFQDSIPIFVISGNVPYEQSIHSQDLNLRQLGVQELNIIPIIKSITNFSYNIKNKDEIISILDTAYEKCISNRMGPVWVDIPLDIQNSIIEHNLLEKNTITICQDEKNDLENEKLNYNLIIEKINQ